MTIETRTDDRKAMAKALAAELGTEAKYLGMPSCAYQVGPYTIRRDGSIEGEDFEAIRSFLASGGYIEEGLPANPDPEPVQEDPDADGSITSMCVTIPLKDYSTQGLVNLLRTLYARQNLLNAMILRGLIHIDQELIDRLADEKPETPGQIQEILRDEIQAGMITGVDLEDGRLKIAFPYDENNPTVWTTYSNVIIAVADRARNAKSANTVLITPAESEMKYFCRSWLMQLGFGGADRKEDRRILLDHLTGFAAFRTADKMEAHKAKLAAKRKSHRETPVPEVTVHDAD